MRTPELTRRDCGELAAYNPPLPVTPATWEIKRLWAEGHKQGEIAKMTGRKKDYVKKFTACFSRALYNPYPGLGEGQNSEKEVQFEQKNTPKKAEQKNRKSLTLNFSKSIEPRHTFIGVTLNRGRGFQAQIRVGKKVRYLGIYKTIIEAAKAYNQEAKRVFGKYAKLNEL